MSFGTLYIHQNPNPRTTAIMAIAEAHGIQLDIVNATRAEEKNFKKLLEINPLGQIPTFVGKDGWVLSECIPIALYITSQSDSTTLMGSNRREYYEIIQWMSFANGDMLPCIGGCILPLIGRPQVIRSNVQDCLRSMHRHFKIFNEHLATRKYLVGTELTTADLFIVAMLVDAYRVFHPMMDSDYSNLMRWFHEIYELPIYKSMAGELKLLNLDYPKLVPDKINGVTPKSS
ncbi:glutathione S-transferase [Truncatella angustata]|uniref:Glutathione S-transferase n=1 Tax=Truncatella angustata TaxID=152316 RepID=A0A9P8UUK9_9PEZI|nr:glutathione S-transferase [Truncatella angustata]KAH6658479.1 glutathione S-transferase [Truncatella angustata]